MKGTIYEGLLERNAAEVKSGVAGQTVQAHLVAEARQMQDALAARGINSVRSNREAQWLADQPD